MAGFEENLEKICEVREKLTAQLIVARSENGLWEGRLSSSAVSTAVAVTALDTTATEEARGLVDSGALWLAKHINSDGGWGDTPESPSNLSAVLLTRAALARRSALPEVTEALSNSAKWLEDEIGGTDPETIRDGVLKKYGKDRTFSVPILVACALGEQRLDRKTWKSIPPLPFELAMLPHGLFKFLRLPVVSYAIPALIAVGLARHRLAKGGFNPVYSLRELAVKKVLKILDGLQPENGGFLEAAPLTGFVTMSLCAAGESSSNVVKRGVEFLMKNVREDGSWPIDTNLSVWLTSLAVKALDGDEFLAGENGASLLKIYQNLQYKEIHPFTKAATGGWGWSDRPGSVPDADDTSGALHALSILQKNYDKTVENGLIWLMDLANVDGGIPTFCRGWGHLPFDRSCPDISAHALQAFSQWMPLAPEAIKIRLQKAIDGIKKYLLNCRDEDGVWSPLWFGDQSSPGHSSRVYGTAAVLESLSVCEDCENLTDKAVNWLKSAQNEAGGWGGEPNSPAVIETTARAVTALAKYPEGKEAALKGAMWLVEQAELNGFRLKSSPIGLYFASLWYDEELYPLVFTISALKEIDNEWLTTNDWQRMIGNG